ncbi:MAG: hypothetical protein COB62_03680 [Piscirickettsiaceae bacterium]|nr:MAG: hypothetical protein COB62_03680 [Piscirickettsiaceae bacterium]
MPEIDVNVIAFRSFYIESEFNWVLRVEMVVRPHPGLPPCKGEGIKEKPGDDGWAQVGGLSIKVNAGAAAEFVKSRKVL